jgi:hypothetical protein
MLAVAKITIDDVCRNLANRLQCPDDREALQRAVIAEHIRTLVFASSTREREIGEVQRLHTTRLTASLRRNLHFVWPDLGRRSGGDDIVDQTLHSMAELGDVATTGGGFWLAAPLRLVDCPDAECLTVVGGAPREAVVPMTGTDLLSAAAARFVSRNGLADRPQSSQFVQSADSWLGTVGSLSAWTQAILKSCQSRMSRPEEFSADQLEIYAPDLLREQRRLGGWISATEVSRAPSGTRLCRPLPAYARTYDRPHYLGTFSFKAGGLVLRQSVRTEFEVAQRLPFGFDEMLKTPRETPVTLHSSFLTLDLRYALPLPERRILSLGWQYRPVRPETRHQWMFHRAALPFILHAFRRVGIDPIVKVRSK